MEASKKRKRLRPRKQVQSKKIGLLIGSGANCKPSSDFTRRGELTISGCKSPKPSPQPSPKGRGGSFSWWEKVRMRGFYGNLHCQFPFGNRLYDSITHSGIFSHQISIGHAGDVIAHRSMQPFALDPPSRRIPKPARIKKVTFEDPSQHLTRSLVYLRHPRVVINILIQKFPERSIGLCQIVTISNEDRLIPDIVSGLNFHRCDLLRAGHDHIPHLTIDDVANDELM